MRLNQVNFKGASLPNVSPSGVCLQALYLLSGSEVRRAIQRDGTIEFQAIEQDQTVYATMNGPSEFSVIGTIRDWQVKDRLGEIGAPTLIVSGRHDEATPRLQRTLLDGIAGSEWVCFEESSHVPHLEERERWLEVVGGFLERMDGAG
jgi:proline-specific peptidase